MSCTKCPNIPCSCKIYHVAKKTSTKKLSCCSKNGCLKSDCSCGSRKISVKYNLISSTTNISEQKEYIFEIVLKNCSSYNIKNLVIQDSLIATGYAALLSLNICTPNSVTPVSNTTPLSILEKGYLLEPNLSTLKACDTLILQYKIVWIGDPIESLTDIIKIWGTHLGQICERINLVGNNNYNRSREITTGTLPANCIKFEDIDIGTENIIKEIEINNIVVAIKLFNWVLKVDTVDEYISVDYMVIGDGFIEEAYAKASDISYQFIPTSDNKQGTYTVPFSHIIKKKKTLDIQHAMSNLVFCLFPCEPPHLLTFTPPQTTIGKITPTKLVINLDETNNITASATFISTTMPIVQWKLESVTENYSKIVYPQSSLIGTNEYQTNFNCLTNEVVINTTYQLTLTVSNECENDIIVTTEFFTCRTALINELTMIPMYINPTGTIESTINTSNDEIVNWKIVDINNDIIIGTEQTGNDYSLVNLENVLVTCNEYKLIVEVKNECNVLTESNVFYLFIPPTVKINNPVNLICKDNDYMFESTITGTPIECISWELNGNQIGCSDSCLISTGNSNLTIGTYNLTVKVTVCNISAVDTVIFNIDEPPHIELSPDNVLACYDTLSSNPSAKTSINVTGLITGEENINTKEITLTTNNETTNITNNFLSNNGEIDFTDKQNGCYLLQANAYNECGTSSDTSVINYYGMKTTLLSAGNVSNPTGNVQSRDSVQIGNFVYYATNIVPSGQTRAKIILNKENISSYQIFNSISIENAVSDVLMGGIQNTVDHIYILGSYSSTTDFGNNNIKTPIGERDIFLAKYDLDLNLVDIISRSEENTYFIASSIKIKGNNIFIVYISTNKAVIDYYDSDLTLKNTSQIDGIVLNTSIDILANEIFIYGQYKNIIIPDIQISFNSNTISDIFFAKATFTNSSITWTCADVLTQNNGEINAQFSHIIYVIDSNNIIVTGTYSGTLIANNYNTNHLTNNQQLNGFIGKLNNNCEWVYIKNTVNNIEVCNKLIGNKLLTFNFNITFTIDRLYVSFQLYDYEDGTFDCYLANDESPTLNLPSSTNRFTLIDLMYVIAIIGILASVSIPTFSDLLSIITDDAELLLGLKAVNYIHSDKLDNNHFYIYTSFGRTDIMTWSVLHSVPKIIGNDENTINILSNYIGVTGESINSIAKIDGNIVTFDNDMLDVSGLSVGEHNLTIISTACGQSNIKKYPFTVNDVL